MPSGKTHELVNISILFLIILLFYPIHLKVWMVTISPTLIEYKQFLATYFLGTYFINADLDANYSRSKNNIGYFRYIFAPFNHHGVLHSPVFWVLIGIICTISNYPYIGLGLAGANIVHITFDLIFDKR